MRAQFAKADRRINSRQPVDRNPAHDLERRPRRGRFLVAALQFRPHNTHNCQSRHERPPGSSHWSWEHPIPRLQERTESVASCHARLGIWNRTLPPDSWDGNEFRIPRVFSRRTDRFAVSAAPGKLTYDRGLGEHLNHRVSLRSEVQSHKDHQVHRTVPASSGTLCLQNAQHRAHQ